jgi:ElaB/YqjD/DUF883 family membrane-anchored ribosome-binding protein
MDEKATPHQSHTGGATSLDHAGMQQQSGGNFGSISGPTMEQAKSTANQAMDQAKTMARNIGDQARSVAGDPSAAAQDLARRAREQASAAGDVLYRQGQRAGEYIRENVNEYPLTALLIAGMIGYGLAFLVHTRWQDQMSWRMGR